MPGFDDWRVCATGSYRDVYYSECSPLVEGPEVRRAYCLHALNHVLKANSRVLSHNARLKEKKGSEEEEFRDQGLTRPKVMHTMSDTHTHKHTHCLVALLNKRL